MVLFIALAKLHLPKETSEVLLQLVFFTPQPPSGYHIRLWTPVHIEVIVWVLPAEGHHCGPLLWVSPPDQWTNQMPEPGVGDRSYMPLLSGVFHLSLESGLDWVCPHVGSCLHALSANSSFLIANVVNLIDVQLILLRLLWIHPTFNVLKIRPVSVILLVPASRPPPLARLIDCARALMVRHLLRSQRTQVLGRLRGLQLYNTPISVISWTIPHTP